jgi:hypothetical protein
LLSIRKEVFITVRWDRKDSNRREVAYGIIKERVDIKNGG